MDELVQQMAETSGTRPGVVAWFLILLCLGVIADIRILMALAKKPGIKTETGRWLQKRTMPRSGLIWSGGALLFFYPVASILYALFFSGVRVGPYTVLLQVLLFHLPVLTVLALWFRCSGLDWRELLGLHRRRAWRMAGLGVVGYLALLPPLLLINVLYQSGLEYLGYEVNYQDVVQILMLPASPIIRAALFFTAIVIAPVVEELFFRGIFFPALAGRIGVIAATAILSVVFAAIHFHLPALAPLFFLSVALCLAYVKTRSLWAPIVLHAVFNAMTILLIVFGT